MPFPFPIRKPLSRLGVVQRPILRKPVVKSRPTFLEKGKFRKTDELITEVKKHSYFKSMPTYGRGFSQKERTNLVKILQKASGATSGLSKSRLKQAIRNLEKEKTRAGYKKQYKRVAELKKQVKQAKVWEKTW